MSITLEAIKFNHNTGSATTDALTIRRNATQPVNVPEWVRGVSVNPEDSPAAYSISDTQGNTIAIQARFQSMGQLASPVEIRAIDPVVDPPGPSGCLGIIYKVLRALIRAASGNVLGEIQARTVSFDGAGDSGFQTFVLQNLRLWDAGVGVRTTTWTWQYRVGAGPWTDIATTNHRIYSVLGTPTAPWVQTGGSTQLPWTEVLDHACSWALLAKNAVAAASAVTRRVYALGPATVEYDCPGSGSSHYTDSSSTFFLTAWLDRLRGAAGYGRYVNCTDCATITSTFANVLGCDLWQSQMGNYFALNPILAIGSSTWQTACGWIAFSYHEVAWTGACGVNDRVYDACMKVDNDSDPTAAPHAGVLPVDMRFGNTGDGDYRDRLATPAGRGSCNPLAGSQRRRILA